MERKYMMYEGEDVNTIDLLYETPTEEPNGVKVIVPVGYYDYHNFKKKIGEQLAYFENVYFNVDGMTNDFTIVRTEHFQFSPLATDRYMHVCLDNVYYPLDYGKLGIDRIDLPVGLRFSLSDGIFPTPNREAIRYTQEAKDIILKKLEQAANYFVEKYNETVKDTDDFKKVYEFHQSHSRMLMIGSSKWDIHPLARYASVVMAIPTMPSIKLLDLKRLIKNDEYILANYTPKYLVNAKTMREAKHYWGLTRMDKLLSKTVYFYEGDKIPGVKKDYIKSLCNSRYEDHTVFRRKPMPLKTKSGDYDCYYKILRLADHPRDKWRAMIVEFQKLVEGITKDFINIDTLDVPQEFIEARKKASKSAVSILAGPKVRKVKLKGEIVCKVAEKLERYVDGKNCKWVSHTYDMAKFHQNPYLYVYGKAEDAALMDRWFEPTLNKNTHIKFITLSERELKVVEKIELHNLIPLKKFMEGKTKAFQRLATACLIDKFYDKYNHVMIKTYVIKEISQVLADKIDRIIKYRQDFFNASMNGNDRNTIIEYASEINAFDPEIIDDLRAVEAVATKLPFLEPMMYHMPRYSSWSDKENKMLQALIDLFKYHKHRIDWKNYKIPFNDDVVTEELTTEVVETLIN